MSARFAQALREFFYGMSGYEFAREANEIRASMETLFMLTIFGDLVGLPVLPPYYALRLLPYVALRMQPFKTRVARERELNEDLHGV